MAKIGRTFHATEQVAGLICGVVRKQFPQHAFSLHLLPYHERNATFYYEIHIDGEYCPEDVGVFLDEYLTRMFPDWKL